MEKGKVFSTIFNKKVIFVFFIILFISISPLSHSLSQYSSTATPIKHVVIIIEENHSFDNLFGTYPFGWPPIINNITLSVMEPEGLYNNYSQLEDSKNGVLNYITVPNVPWFSLFGSSHPYYADAWDTADPYEGWTSYHGDYWFDTEDGFVYYSGPQSMAYFSYQQAGLLWDYAEEYVLADNYFSPVLGLTEPNRIAYMIGQPPNFYTDDVCNAIPLNESIMYQLQQYNVSWGYFAYGYNGEIPWPMYAFIGINNYKNDFHSLTTFYEDLEDGNLPTVSWVMFISGYDDKYDMHPPYNITSGAVEITKIINAIMRSPYWNSTVIFITFDEGGGYYDQITPPSINHYGLGQRIPLLIISPYAKEAWINNYTLSGYTLLGFIDYNWHLPYLTKIVEESDVQGLLQSFNFSAKPRPPLILEPNNWTYPIPLQYPVHYGYIALVNPHKGYSQVYSAPELSLLLPIEVIAFGLTFLSFKFKKLLLPGLLLMIVTLGISGFLDYSNNIYSFVTEYYMYSSLIGFLISGILALKRYRVYLKR
uniref:Acid phosphatase n=1 Tax=Acidianus sulfidivorans JP7 TaxID=619593 RepID=A0A2U9IPI9_9CREN